MHEFIIQHIDSIASIVTLLGGVAAIIFFFLSPMKTDIADIKADVKDLKDEHHKFHTRLTWLDGYIARGDKDDLKHK